MLGSISPVGEASRAQRWWLTASAHALASTGAGAALGGLLGAVGAALTALAPLPAGTRLLLLAGAAVAGAAVDAGLVRGGPPSWRRQVDERWLTTYRGWVYGAGFGAQLGLGVVTIVTSAATYAALLAALLSASPRGGLLIGGAFGALRSLPLLLMAGVRDAATLHAVTGRVAGAQPLARTAGIAGQGALGAIALLAALSGQS